MPENETINLEIQPTKCFQQFDQSFNRIKYFTCIADNIETKNLPVEWTIKDESAGMNYAMNVPSEEKKEKILHGFQYFLRRYLVRDCIESFALCLDEMCFVLLLLREKKRTVRSNQSLYDVLCDDEREILRDFQSKGLSPKDGKVGILRKEFKLELSNDNKKIIRGLKDIRDCLAHRNGIASDRDGDAAQDRKRKFHWLTLDCFIVDNETKKELILEIGKEYNLPKGGGICIRIKEHTKLVKVGDPLSFTSIEIYEIAQSLQWVAKAYLEQIS